MKSYPSLLAVSVSIAILVAGCSKVGDGRENAGAAAQAGSAVKPAFDNWLGKWAGPEGTYLLLSGEDGKYRVTIRNLDGARTFDGSAAREGIVFERDGVKEVVRQTSGVETGMKRLAHKSNCLTIRSGEGYCKE